MGFCLGCPVPEILAEIKKGESEFCKRGLLTSEDVRDATVALVRAISLMGECKQGPAIAPITEDESWIRCQHDYGLEIDSLGDALETDNAGLVLGSKAIKREQI